MINNEILTIYLIRLNILLLKKQTQAKKRLTKRKRTMAKVDLHVHSAFSSHPSEWFLQRLGASESYTDPEKIVREAFRSGMTFVTVTDHNEIAGSIMLKEKYPRQVFTGAEMTTYFPENGCKVHLLVYGLSEQQFSLIDKLRPDIYQLRDYIREQDLAHSVAHATYAVNRKLSLNMIEKLMLLFDYFEGINGSRSRISNEVLMDALSSLTPERIEDLRLKHRIDPYSDTAWIKGFTGGSDDHSGLFIGKTHTYAKAETPEEFLDQLKMKQTLPGGRHNDYKGLAFALYKIAYDFSKTKSGTLSSSLLNMVNTLIFDHQAIGFKDRLMLKKMKITRGDDTTGIKKVILELAETFQQNTDLAMEDKLELVYEKISDLGDCLFTAFMGKIEQHVRDGDLLGVVQCISGSIPGVFLSVPFFTTMDLLHESRVLLNALTGSYGKSKPLKRKTMMAFTDNTDIPALVSAGIPGTGEKDNIVVAVCGANTEAEEPFCHRIKELRLPEVYSCDAFISGTAPLRFPSVLGSIKKISAADPDEIILLTSGPTALLGLLVSRMLHVPCACVYAPFSEGLADVAVDEDLARMAEVFLKWFYSMSDTIIVRSDVHMAQIQKSGNWPDKKIIRATEVQPVPVVATVCAEPAGLVSACS